MRCAVIVLEANPLCAVAGELRPALPIPRAGGRPRAVTRTWPRARGAGAGAHSAPISPTTADPRAPSSRFFSRSQGLAGQGMRPGPRREAGRALGPCPRYVTDIQGSNPPNARARRRRVGPEPIPGTDVTTPVRTRTACQATPGTTTCSSGPEEDLLYSLSADGKRKFMHPRCGGGATGRSPCDRWAL